MVFQTLFIIINSINNQALPDPPNYEDIGLKSLLFIMLFALAKYAYNLGEKKDRIVLKHGEEKDLLHEKFRKEVSDIQEKTLVVLNLHEKSNENILAAVNDLKKTIQEIKDQYSNANKRT